MPRVICAVVIGQSLSARLSTRIVLVSNVLGVKLGNQLVMEGGSYVVEELSR
jgi:hypothetical protein